MLHSLLVAVLLTASAAPTTKDPCGNAATVNQAYQGASGRVVEVTSGDSIRVQMDETSPSEAWPSGSVGSRSTARSAAAFARGITSDGGTTS